MTVINFLKKCLLLDVLCVSNYLDYILAGIGSDLFAYKNQTLEFIKQIFIGERIHKIHVKSNAILIKGGRELSVLNLTENSGSLNLTVKCLIKCNDWIQDSVLLDNNVLALTTAHNYVQFWNLKTCKCLKEFSCEEKCILYCCQIIGNTENDIIIFSGTVFGDILLWKPNPIDEKCFMKRLKSHEGAVFSIEVNVAEKIICTTSDDRSLKVWYINNSGSTIDWLNAKIDLVHTLFGHTARVWRSLIVSNFYITVGEDSKLIIWSKEGKLLKTLTLHQGSGIRALYYSMETNNVITGGEDGGINLIPKSFLTSESKPTKILDFEQNFSATFFFTKYGFTYTLSGGCVMVTTQGEEEIYRNDVFKSYCLMEVSSNGDYIILGSLSGHLVIIDVSTKDVKVEGKYLDGRAYSIHWLNDNQILTCGPEGKLDLWEFINNSIKNLKTMTLPNSKERWSTCCAIHNNYLTVGDRLGNLHVFDIRGNRNPVHSFRKIHSYLGVTDVRSDGELILTVGRDGTLKTFTQDFNHSLTQKLPVEWPCKILPYKNDKLILGFHGVSLVIWSTKLREIIASHNCGGGHRSFDFKLNKNKLAFLYIKEKKVFVVDLNLEGINKIKCGFHSREINCLKMIPSSEIIVSGSEDTTLRISRIIKNDIEEIDVLKTHTSSIRAISVWVENPREIFIVSAGGKGQIIIFSFDLNTKTCKEIINHNLRNETHNWKSLLPSVNPDTRFMCVSVIKLNKEFVIAAGCSDCQIRIFTFNETLKLLYSVSYTHCILNIHLLVINSKTLMVSMGTDGRVVFWNMTDSGRISRLQSFSVHQSGINSFQFAELNYEKFILATGGDDNLIQVSLIQYSNEKLSFRKLWNDSESHSCQITGIKILKNIMITTSIDQRITVWKWSLKEDDFEIVFLNQYITTVPDIQGMDARRQGDGNILVCVFGKGMELLDVMEHE